MIPHNLPSLGIEEEEAASGVLRSGWVAQGSEVEAFENELCDFFGIPNGHAVALASGSAALYLAMWVLDGNDKRFGLPVYACSSLRNAVGLVKGHPIYFDCNENSPNMDISAAINSNIDILVAPSMFGIPIEIPRYRNVKIIEDIAQSIGALSNGQRIGLRGELGICSFYATKMITSGGQGGAIISRDKNLISEIRDYRKFDCRRDEKLRFNFQMTDLQASIGRIQLKKLPFFIESRERIFARYCDAGFPMLENNSAENVSIRYRAIIRTLESKKIIEILKADGINAIIPIEEYELLDNTRCYSVASNLACTSVSLPCYPSLSEENQSRIINSLMKII